MTIPERPPTQLRRWTNSRQNLCIDRIIIFTFWRSQTIFAFIRKLPHALFSIDCYFHFRPDIRQISGSCMIMSFAQGEAINLITLKQRENCAAIITTPNQMLFLPWEKTRPRLRWPLSLPKIPPFLFFPYFFFFKFLNRRRAKTKDNQRTPRQFSFYL